jgi:hypothetical protein
MNSITKFEEHEDVFVHTRMQTHKHFHSPPTGGEFKKEWSYTSTTPDIIMVWCLISTRDNFTFTLPSCGKG